MADEVSDSPQQRLYQAIYGKSLKRLRKRGLKEEDAQRVAKVVAARSIERSGAPDVHSEEHVFALVSSVCAGLSEGKSFFELIGERPFLGTVRLDRLMGMAGHVKPAITPETVVTARKAAKLERLSGAVAVLFMAVAIATLGPWYALAVGVAVAVAAEIYVQRGMPRSVRIAAARVRLPRYMGVAAILALAYLGYEWLKTAGRPFVYGVGLALAAFVVAFLVPGLTMAVMVGRRERKWRRGLEQALVKALDQREEDGRDT